MNHMASLQHVEINFTSGSRGVRERLRAGRGKPVSCPWWLRGGSQDLGRWQREGALGGVLHGHLSEDALGWLDRQWGW